MQMKRAIEELQAQNRAMAKRIETLETEKEKATRKAARKPEPAQKKEQVGRKTTVDIRKKGPGEKVAAPSAEKQEQLDQRVTDLEMAKDAQEDATRSIIRDSLSRLDSKINKYVTFGGNFEVLAGWNQDFSGQPAGSVVLNTAELDFEIAANEWVLGSIVFEWDDGRGTVVQTTEGVETGVERANLDTAFVTVGDTQRFPLFLQTGRVVLPFGISTGNPVADVLTSEDPLTIEAFETRHVAIGIGAAFPTPEPGPAPPPVAAPPVQPQVIAPLVTTLAKALGYVPPPKQPSPQAAFVPAPEPPPFNAGIFLYDGDTFDGTGGSDTGFTPGEQFSATVGYRQKFGRCGRPYAELGAFDFCPWSVDVDVDFNSSVFDSRFLKEAYRSFLGQVGFVPGMAFSAKATAGPFSFVGEWNGALQDATLIDEGNNDIRIRPSAWQVSLGYQFDWNPWVEAIGAQGTYVAFGYSESRDLAGVLRVLNNQPARVGFLSKRRLIMNFSEWVLDGFRVGIEYSHNWDYSVSEGGTGRTANGVFGTFTYVW